MFIQLHVPACLELFSYYCTVVMIILMTGVHMCSYSTCIMYLLQPHLRFYGNRLFFIVTMISVRSILFLLVSVASNERQCTTKGLAAYI